MSHYYHYAGNFVIITENTKLISEETYITPASINGNGKIERYEKRHRTREVTTFHSLLMASEIMINSSWNTVIEELMDAIALVEFFRSFVGNRLESKKTYRIGKIEARMVSRTVEKEKSYSVELRYNNQESESTLYLGKFEAAAAAAKISKVLGRCEPIGKEVP